jgi:DNA-binding IclR family transcriptional regulator
VAVRGFATDLEECAAGLSCTAAPVFDADGRVVAALSVSAPRFRLGEGPLLEAAVEQVVAAGEELSRDLGYGV